MREGRGPSGSVVSGCRTVRHHPPPPSRQSLPQLTSSPPTPPPHSPLLPRPPPDPSLPSWRDLAKAMEAHSESIELVTAQFGKRASTSVHRLLKQIFLFCGRRGRKRAGGGEGREGERKGSHAWGLSSSPPPPPPPSTPPPPRPPTNTHHVILGIIGLFGGCFFCTESVIESCTRLKQPHNRNSFMDNELAAASSSVG